MFHEKKTEFKDRLLKKAVQHPCTYYRQIFTGEQHLCLNISSLFSLVLFTEVDSYKTLVA